MAKRGRPVGWKKPDPLPAEVIKEAGDKLGWCMSRQHKSCPEVVPIDGRKYRCKCSCHKTGGRN